MNIIEFCTKLSQDELSKTAIIQPNGDKISYQEFKHNLFHVSGYLQSLGVAKGDRVFLLIPMSIELYTVIAAIFQLGAVVVFIDPWATKDYIRSALDQANVDYLIYDPKALPLILLHSSIRQIHDQISVSEIFKKCLDNKFFNDHIENLKAEDSALITFTTGSTGNPKGCNRTQGFLSAQHTAHKKYYSHQETDCDLVMFPVFTLSNLASKMTTVLINGNLKKVDRSDPSKIVNQIIDHNVTSFTLSPSVALLISNFLNKSKRTIGSVKKIFIGGAPIPHGLFELTKIVFPNAETFLVYGSSEAEPIALLDADSVIKQFESHTHQGLGVPLGHPVSEINLKIIEPHKQIASLTEVTPGKIGEITLNGPFVGKEYILDDASNAKIKDEQGEIWHRTGDIGYISENNLYMVGRINSKIETQTRQIYPLEIEPLIDALPSVKRCAIFQDGQIGKTVGIIFIPENDSQIATDDIKNICKKFAITLTKIVPVKEIPQDKRHNSKIDYKEVIKMYSEDSINTQKKQSLPKRLLAYTNERFPLLAILLFVIFFTFDAFYLFQVSYAGGITNHFSLPILFGLITIFLTFFHVRLFDEFKDYHDDCIAHPDRLLSKGVVTLKDLGRLLKVVVIFELALNVFFTKIQFFSWLLILVYSYLMFKEFYAKEYLKPRMLLYLVSHQLLLPIMIFYCAQVATQAGPFELIFSMNNLIIVLFITLLSFGYEISRKTWSEDREHPQADSYSKSWGIKNSVSVIIFVNFCILICSIYLNSVLILPTIGILFSIFIFIASTLLTVNFLLKPTNKHSKLVELGGIITLLGNHLVMILMTTLQ